MGEPMRPFWRYYGGKWQVAPHYPAPAVWPIVEPFAGAAGYSTRHGAGREVILVDANPIIAGIWRWLIQATPDDVRAIGDIPEGGTVDDIDAPQEARWLAGFWCNDAAVAPCKRASKFALANVERGVVGGWNARARDRIAAQVPLIKRWTVVEGDYRAAPDIRATWFVDPPYQNKAGSYYPCQPDSFEALGAWCRSRRGLTIVCENEGATWLPFEPLAGRRAAPTSRTGKKTVEAVWLGGELRQPTLWDAEVAVG